MKTILTGIKPTGYPHLGNYFGAILPAIKLSEQEDTLCCYFIADYHALTTLESAEKMKEYTRHIAACWLACGLNPDRVIFYKQSDLPQTFELSTILSNVTPKGLMDRAHAYKALVDKNLSEKLDADSGINMGLYNYPILMCADILLMNTSLVPVGLDQKQHIEFARDIAIHFNKKYGKTFDLPEDFIDKNVCTICGLDGRKMSKSYSNQIPIYCSEAELLKYINKLKTDCSLPTDPKPLDCTVNQIYKLFASDEEQKIFEQKLQTGMGWGDAKKELFRVMNIVLSPIREKYAYYLNNPEVVEKILSSGKEKAQKIANVTIQKVRKAIGV